MAQFYNSQLDAFDIYHQVQEVHQAKDILSGPALPALGHATAGSIGAAISNIVTYPLALIVTRLQIQRSLRRGNSQSDNRGYRSLKDAAQQIYEHEGGLAGFYAGVGPDTAKTIADSFLFFLAYNFIRQTRLRARGASIKYLPVVDELSVGFLAGAFSKFWTTPIANIVTRQQAASMLSSGQSTPPRLSIRDTSSQIREENGLQGFWSGYSASLVLTLNPSLTFFLFETLKRLLVPRDKRANPPAQVTFLIAAVSKAIATTTTYPFSLAKSRAQVSSESIKEKGVDEKATVDEIQKKTGLGATKTKAKASSNVFSTILKITRAEGYGALYEGLGGDVLKGFFSHGLTMIVKQVVHRFIIQLYYAILRLLKRFPSPEAMAQVAKDKSDRAFDAIQKKTEPYVTSASEKLQYFSSTAIDSSQSALESVRVHANSASTTATQRAGDVAGKVSDLLDKTKDQLTTKKTGDKD
ncbi:MAG: hypothetical protein Q9209_000995 [Squamulea sp. 1 TL-2023]